MELVERSQCTGCFACEKICPKSCIEIVYDKMGNGYPFINRDVCIECGKCNQVCPERTFTEFQTIKKAFAAWSLNKNRRKKSASGGVAAEFYDSALRQGYLICGAMYQKDFQVIHVLTNDKRKIEDFQQSKYVFSNTSDVYRKIRRQLIEQKQILFISLPCKVAALKSYLGKSYDDLLTVDIVCHGTPPYQYLKEHILGMYDLNKCKNLNFRVDNEFKFCLQDDNEKQVYCKTGRTDTYLAAFLEGLDYRDSCYQCKYARAERISDITLCDFWGLGSEKPFNHPYTGAVSAILVNNEKGESFLKQCQDKFFLEERPVSEAIKGNAQLNKPTSIHKLRKVFEEKYCEVGFEKAVKYCLKDEMRNESMLIIKRKIRSQLRSIAGIFINRYRG